MRYAPTLNGVGSGDHFARNCQNLFAFRDLRDGMPARTIEQNRRPGCRPVSTTRNIRRDKRHCSRARSAASIDTPIEPTRIKRIAMESSRLAKKKGPLVLEG
jgi:hypothetical protein